MVELTCPHPGCAAAHVYDKPFECLGDEFSCGTCGVRLRLEYEDGPDDSSVFWLEKVPPADAAEALRVRQEWMRLMGLSEEEVATRSLCPVPPLLLGEEQKNLEAARRLKANPAAFDACWKLVRERKAKTMSETPLKSVADHNAEIRRIRAEREAAMRETGVACPNCGKELEWVMTYTLTAQYPPPSNRPASCGPCCLTVYLET